jgi:hypothetical protein
MLRGCKNASYHLTEQRRLGAAWPYRGLGHILELKCCSSKHRLLGSLHLWKVSTKSKRLELFTIQCVHSEARLSKLELVADEVP